MTYENWILNPPTLRPRTYLYHLEPIGIGTPLVESLTSYIGRLAAAHAVSMGILSTKEFGPRVSKSEAQVNIMGILRPILLFFMMPTY